MAEQPQTQETQNQPQEVKDEDLSRPLTNEELIRIAEKVKQNNPTEYKYFLRIRLFSNSCHPNRRYSEDFETLYGDAKIIEVSAREDQCDETYEYLIIPMSSLVVLHLFARGGYPQDESDVIYVFTPETGWIAVPHDCKTQ